MAKPTGHCLARIENEKHYRPDHQGYLWFVECAEIKTGKRHAIDVFYSRDEAKNEAGSFKAHCVTHRDFTVECVIDEDLDLYLSN